MNQDMRAVQQQAQDDKIAAIQDRLSQQTRDILIQYGRRKAFSGASLPGFSGPGASGLPLSSF